MSEIHDADRIAADGITLNLAGRQVRVRYTMRSWRMVEDRFGSMAAALAALRWMVAPADTEPVAKPVDATITLLAAGLLHEGLTEDDLWDATNITDLHAYQAAVLQAVDQGTPGPGPGKGAAADGSRGATTTTPSPSDSAAAMASSGT